MIKKLTKKQQTLKAVAQLATFVAVSVCVTAALGNSLPTNKAVEIACRVGKGIIWYIAVNTSVNGVGKLFDDAFNETVEVKN